MGIGFVLIIWSVIGLVAAAVGSAVLPALVECFTDVESLSGRRLVRAATRFPFGCLVWAGVVFVFQAVVNVGFLHRDPGLGNGFDCPLPNGYALSFVGVTDIGTLYDPKDLIREREVSYVRTMQLAGPYVLGGCGSSWVDRAGEEIATYFLLDTRTGKRADFKSFDELRQAARQVNVEPGLVPIGSIYTKYRFTWFDLFVAMLLVGPPLIRAVFLVRWTLRLGNGPAYSVA